MMAVASKALASAIPEDPGQAPHVSDKRLRQNHHSKSAELF